MDEARAVRRRLRDRNPAGLRCGGFRRGADARTARTGTTPPRAGEEIKLALVIPGCAAWRRPGIQRLVAPDSGFALGAPRHDSQVIHTSRTHDHAIHDADDSPGL